MSPVFPQDIARFSLTADPNDLFQHLVCRGQDTGIGRIGALGDDHAGKLLGDVDGRGFQSLGGDHAGTARVRCIEDDLAGVVGYREGVAVACLEAAGVGELGERDLVNLR